MKLIYQHKAAHKEIKLLQEQNKKLNELLENMQADVRSYLIPDKTACSQEWLVSRLIWWLDGPEQRKAQNKKRNDEQTYRNSTEKNLATDQ